MRVRFQLKLIVFIGSLLFCVIGGLVASFQYMAATTLQHEIGERALKIAETVAMIPDIRKAFSVPDPTRIIQPIAEAIRKATGAEFVVVGNREGIRYSHPVPDRIGKEMVGGNISKVLAGQSIIEQAVGTLGPSLRGKTPIYNEQEKIVGLVSVGFLTNEVDSTIAMYRDRIVIMGILALVIGMVGTLAISRQVKQAILGLEPEEIGRLYQEERAVLESIREGIVAIDAQGIVTTVNQTAYKMLGWSDLVDLIGQRIDQIDPHHLMLKVLRSGTPEFDQQMMIVDQVVIANVLPVFDSRGHLLGAVSSFRYKSELNRLIEELSQVREYAEALRAQTHEYSNKLYMISGLIQLESYQEAIELITHESGVQQNLIHFIMNEIPDPMIGGLLIGKYNRASELKVDLEINRESSLRDLPAALSRDLLATIIGNLIDNAFEAVLSTMVTDKLISLFITDIGKDIIIEVEDHGNGIPTEYMNRIFERGFSTKSAKNRGFGLALVKHGINQLRGNITFTSSPQGGTIFTVMIPKSEVGIHEINS
jgi:two-component system CitB family sensor kinase